MASLTPSADPDDEDLQTIATEQRLELMAARALDSDLDFAFSLQLEEAISASLSLQSSSSSSPPAPAVPLNPPPADGGRSVADLQSQEIDKFEQEIKDRMLSEAEFKRTREDLHRLIHDQKLAREIEQMPEDEWEESGDNYERPYGEGCSKNVSSESFKVYFKGLVDTETVGKSPLRVVAFAGIGVAICDSRDQLIFEVKKPLVGHGINRQGAEAKALIEALNAAAALGLENIVFYCDYYTLYQFVTGRWLPKQQKITALTKQVAILLEKFSYSRAVFVARNDVKFAFKLAREAILSQINKPAESSNTRNLHETCVICLEDKDVGQIFSVDGCKHRYCFSCMKQHVEVKLLYATVPKCPHEACNSELQLESCRKFLTTKLIDIMCQRVKEASIPVTEKVYCPYPKCSALMSRSEVLEYSKRRVNNAERCGARKCIKCNSNFCVNCKAPWHSNMTCSDYKRKNPYPLVEDAILKNVAAENRWRQCIKCNHMIELDAGCYHMTCRCGYEFCYTCGAEWKNKKATCSCRLWDERNIIYEQNEDDDDNEEEEEEDEEYYDSDSDDYY